MLFELVPGLYVSESQIVFIDVWPNPEADNFLVSVHTNLLENVMSHSIDNVTLNIEGEGKKVSKVTAGEIDHFMVTLDQEFDSKYEAETFITQMFQIKSLLKDKEKNKLSLN